MTVEDLGEPPTTAYWLAWATAFLLIIAVVAAGVMNLSGDGSEDGFVSAAGQTSGTVDVPTTSTTTLPPAPPPQTPTTSRPSTPTSTTVPKAASAVLRAIGTTAPPTTRAPVTTSTTAPAPTPTTAPPAPTSSTTTSTTLPPKATVTVVNEYTRAFEITVNKQTVTLDPGTPRTLQVDVPPNVTDEIKGHALGEPPCEVGGVGDLFQAGGRYRVAIVPDGTCAKLDVTQI
jgi:hypothetical protein